MSALLKVYTDSGHTSEVSHTTQNSTTTNGALSAGATSITLTSTTGMPTQGWLDIVDGTNGNETIAYYGLSGNTVTVANTGGLAHLHPTGTTVNQWYYSLAVGDQTNGIINDGTQATPTGSNTSTWYVYNAGDQTAQSPSIATSNTSPSTTSGYADTLVSITSASSGFATSVSPSNIAAGGVQQFWVVAEIPSGQSAVGNPQVCVVNLSYSSI